MNWSQVYDPLGNAFLSTAFAALPIVVLLGSLGVFRVRAHYAALMGLAASLLVALTVFRMPVGMTLASAVYGAAYGLFPIGWIVLNVIFLYQLTNECGLFEKLRHSITGLTEDARLQLLLVAFSFGAFIEGACGFGTPVAVTGAILIGLGLHATGRIGTFADRQHRAGRVWCSGRTVNRPPGCNRPGSESIECDGRTPASVLFVIGAVLVDLGLRRFSRDAGDLAGDSGGRHCVRGPAIFGFEFSWTMAGRCCGGVRFDWDVGVLLKILATEENMARVRSPTPGCPAGQPGWGGAVREGKQ
jgi:hypothetical protein